MFHAPSSTAPGGDSKLTLEVTRGVCRHLIARGIAPITEFVLPNGRRADIAGMDEKGIMTFVEVKVSLADFRGDTKWPDYLDFCDQFFFAVPKSFPSEMLNAPACRPELTGLMIADRFDAAVVRPAGMDKMAAARRKAQSLRFARKAALRLQSLLDPENPHF